MKIKIKNIRKGQGVVESVFAVGILALLLGGIVVLIVLGVSNRRASFDRRKATELATMVTEDLVATSQNDPQSFWQFNNVNGLSKGGYSGYTYSVGYTNIVAVGTSYSNCGIGKTDCAEVVISIGWSGKNSQTIYFNRFFSKDDFIPSPTP
jgi:hypothetical protein